MKNITISLPEDLYRRARMKAAEQDTSVSAVVKAFLIEFTQQETDFERRKRLQREVMATIRDFRAGERLDRESAHERSGN